MTHQRYIEPTERQELIAQLQRDRGAIHCTVHRDQERLVELRYFKQTPQREAPFPTHVKFSFTADETADLIELWLAVPEVGHAFASRSLIEVAL